MATKIDKARRFANDFLREHDCELSEEGAELFAQAILAFEEAAQQSVQADEGYECHCNAEHAHMTYIAHEDGCPARLRR